MPETKQSVADVADERAAKDALKKLSAGGKLTNVERTAIRRDEKRLANEQREKAYRAIPQKELGEIIGTPVRMVRKWTGMGMPRNAGGSYDLFAVLPWLRERWSSDRAEAGKGTADAAERKLTAQAAKAEHELAVLEGRFVEREEMERLLVGLVVTARRAIQNLPRELAQRLSGMEPREIEALITSRIDEILTELSGERTKARGKKK